MNGGVGYYGLPRAQCAFAMTGIFTWGCSGHGAGDRKDRPYEVVCRGGRPCPPDAVQRRIPPVTASPCQPPLGKGALGTGDADCHSQCAHWLRNDIVFCKECGTKPGGSSGRPTPTHRLSIELRRGRRPRRPVCTSPHICVGRRALTPPFVRKKTRGKPRFPPARTQNYLSAATDLTTLTSRPL